NSIPSTSNGTKDIFVRASEPYLEDITNVPLARSSETKKKSHVEQNFKTRKAPLCFSCGVKGHTYHDCWYVEYDEYGYAYTPFYNKPY
ncbi:hypothetical protein, partial [Microbacterium sp. ZXX196]|uniref:hypothetical protein n=1 Tax=Microbacterium sp. ZXX196 TaxID=2609291 RepID=UPI001E5456F3